MNQFLAKLHNRFAFLRRRVEKKLAHNKDALALFQRLHQPGVKHIRQQTIAQTRFVVVDTETTGLQAYAGDEIIEIALIELLGLKASGREYRSYINPQRSIPATSTAIHHITDQMVAQAPSLIRVLPEIIDFIGDAVLVGHHVSFDLRFINKTLHQYCHGIMQTPCVDTMLLYLEHRGQIGHYSLEEVACACGVDILNRHSALGDATATARIFQQLVPRILPIHESTGRLLSAQHKTNTRW